MDLTSIVPNPDDLKRTMGQMPSLTAGLGQPPGPEPTGGMPSLGTLPPLGGNSAPSSAGMGGLKPIVTSPRQQQEQELQQKISSYENPTKPQGFWQKLGHGLAVAGNVAGSIVEPNLMGSIPGTMAFKQNQEDRRTKELAGLQGQDITERQQSVAEQKQSSETGLQAAQGNYYNQHADAIGQHQVTPDEAAAMGVPQLAGSMMDPKAWEQLIKQQGINQTRVTTNAATNLSRQDIAKLKPEQRDDRAIHLNEKAALGQPLTQEEQAYLGAYGKYIQQTKVDPGVARAQAFGMFRPVQVLGPDGSVQYQFSGNAINSGASSPQSMNFRTAVGMSKFMTSGKGGQTVTAYNTANDHLELLGKAMDALQNGDVQAINQMSNSFKQQFGSAAPTNVNAVKAMLAGELANVAKVTGATDQEINEQKDNLNRASSPEQIKGFIDTNHDLMDQKAYEMYQQYQQGEQGRPAFNTGLTGRGVGGGQTQKFTVGNTSYNIPVDQVAEFKKDHPNAR